MIRNPSSQCLLRPLPVGQFSVQILTELGMMITSIDCVKCITVVVRGKTVNISRHHCTVYQFSVGYRTLDEFQLDAVSFTSDTLDDGKGT